MVIKEESQAFVYAAKCFGRVIRDVFVLRSRYARARLMPDRPDVLNVPLRAAIAPDDGLRAVVAERRVARVQRLERRRRAGGAAERGRAGGTDGVAAAP